MLPLFISLSYLMPIKPNTPTPKFVATVYANERTGHAAIFVYAFDRGNGWMYATAARDALRNRGDWDAGDEHVTVIRDPVHSDYRKLVGHLECVIHDFTNGTPDTIA